MTDQITGLSAGIAEIKFLVNSPHAKQIVRVSVAEIWEWYQEKKIKPAPAESNPLAILDFIKKAHLRGCGSNLVTDCGESCQYAKEDAIRELMRLQTRLIQYQEILKLFMADHDAELGDVQCNCGECENARAIMEREI